MPFLSIIIPVYNKANYLDSCIKSILAQSFTDFELILINDGSTDGSGDKCDNYSDLDKRITVFHQSNQGVSTARNKGLSIAKGSYIGFIDADDTIESDMYELLVNNCKLTNADLSICSIVIRESESFEAKRSFNINREPSMLSQSATLSALLNGKINWSANNKIYKRELATNVAFKGRMNEDLLYCFNVICLMRGHAVFADEEKYNYIKRENSVSLTKFSEKQLESINVSKKILQSVSLEFEKHVEEAKILDLISNLSILNLIILAEEHQSSSYAIVAQNLRNYKPFIKTTQKLSKRQKYATQIFILNDKLYRSLLKTYCFIFQTEAGKKTL
ncbi:MAG: glycosyltransferase [Pedobacter sp.]|nr:MAG: glycosyltransferase [Pedobacter sp.]